MTYFTRFYLDNEKDILVVLFQDLGRLFYQLETPNHHTGNLIRNLAGLCDLPLSENEQGLLVIRGEIPCYIDVNNQEVYVFRLGKIKMANIYPDGRVEMKGAIPAISKTLMSQTRDYRMDMAKTIFKTYIPREYKFRSDLHTHMNANLSPDILIALGIYHQLRYPLYYVKKLDLRLTDRQRDALSAQREKVVRQFAHSDLQGKYLDRKINDNTFINFADLILNNLDNASENISRIRTSLVIMKDGQAVFTNLEKVYLYRYVFTKGQESEEKIPLTGIESIPESQVKDALRQMLKDGENPDYHHNSVFMDALLWIARSYRRKGIYYTEISDTTLVKKYESVHMLNEVHRIMPRIYRETGVMIRFLAAIRRIPLTIVKDQITPENYLARNLNVLQAVAWDPYVAGCDFVGEEINDINTLKPVIREIVRIARRIPGFVIRIHAGENDSQKDNIAHSIECVRDSLEEGQEMPRVRLGHGLYTYSLRSAKGKKVLEDLKKYHIALEFQLTSNVRLNNLNALKNHPLRQYIRAGIPCVQGTDGAALYGTDSIDEQLALENMLNLSSQDMLWMKSSENEIIEAARIDYSVKKRNLEQMLAGRSLESFLLKKMDETDLRKGLHLNRSNKLNSYTELKEKIRELPWNRMPVVLMGGSFNTSRRSTRTTPEGMREIDLLLDHLDPDESFFVIGHKMSGYEKYLTEQNSIREKPFKIFAVVPSLISREEKKRLEGEKISIRISTESEGMGIYKSFNYEIFERRPSLVIGFDGNSAGSNLIQEAKNGKGHAEIYIWNRCMGLQEKARSLEGYVTFFGETVPLVSCLPVTLLQKKYQTGS